MRDERDTTTRRAGRGLAQQSEVFFVGVTG